MKRKVFSKRKGQRWHVMVGGEYITTIRGRSYQQAKAKAERVVHSCQAARHMDVNVSRVTKSTHAIAV